MFFSQNTALLFKKISHMFWLLFFSHHLADPKNIKRREKMQLQITDQYCNCIISFFSCSRDWPDDGYKTVHETCG